MGAGNPVGQAAWIAERFHDWSDLRTKSMDAAYPKDRLLTNIMLYVMTGSFTTGAWYYRGLVEEGGLAFGPGAGSQLAFIEELGGVIADRRGQPPGLRQEQPLVRGDCRLAVQQMVQRRALRSLGMAPLGGLIKLLGVADQDEGGRGLGDGQDVGQRHLRRLVDE